MIESTGRHRSPIRRRGLGAAASWVWVIAGVALGFTLSLSVLIAHALLTSGVTWVQP
jgi:hypothetical protein